MATRVKVVKARNLPAMDINGKSDPYCKLSVREKQVRSRIVYEDLNPIWEEEFFFEGKKGGILLVEVWDYDKFSSDDFIGSVIIQLERLPEDFSDWVPLEGKAKGQKTGELMLEIKYIP
eukprot:Phypoly_transcript_30327.p1 GENE.Phypoly_transcript_30327~~Phypoly_transcript_30327.p1  ORF type:complete len:119 (+),score=20.26 Phypoly_transcript_30327:64-420(+)